ncbi:uncharacterized protein [Physcomitrium patens]|uniref:uncharacterized protein isoform X4 n=1 Tax=Physcomitrium patens TaxID=3218 RepID=UPI003CCE2E2E
MVGERTGRQTLGTASSHRRRLSNITNLINGGSWSNENDLVKNTCGSTELQLQQAHRGSVRGAGTNPELDCEQEIKRLEQINIEKDLVIAEKEHEIESQKSFMHKMQRDFYANIYKRSQQNEDIIGFNTRLSKELSTVREQLKMLHHEYTQMTIVYKVNESELQTRLAEAQEQLRRVCEEKEKASHEPLNSDGVPPTVVRRTHIWNPSTNTHSMSSLDTSAVTTRGGVRQKAGTLPQKDTSVKLKIRQHDCASVPIIVPACTTKRYNNRYGHLYNLEPMQEVEESEALSSSNSTSRLPRGNPCLESLSSEVVERESSANYESFSEGQRAGEITSTSECNEARVTHSSEPRLSVKVSKNHCEKNPPPARPNTPQRRSASQPTTPRNRSEIQVALQRKASSQPSTPGSTSPVQHTHSLPASRSSLSRTRGSSPSKHIESDQLQPPSRTSVGGRPSRRASVGVVSYKEPSLITKMRRPN